VLGEQKGLEEGLLSQEADSLSKWGESKQTQSKNPCLHAQTSNVNYMAMRFFLKKKEKKNPHDFGFYFKYL